MGPSDPELIARVLTADDRHAFGVLVRRHQSSVRGLLRRLTVGDDALSDDLAQETFVRAYRGLSGYSGRAQFSSWLFRVAYNVFLSQRRRLEPPAQVVPEAALSLSKVDARHDLVRAWEVLRPEEQAALALTYGQEMTHEEAADVLEWPLGTLKTHVARGKERLRTELNDGAWRSR
jgi:RNA polymerase sigma-70 factor (ECF subfamily)